MGKRRTGRNRECPDHLLSVSPTYFQVRRGPCPDHFNPTQCPEGNMTYKASSQTHDQDKDNDQDKDKDTEEASAKSS